jgi:hypothetical protein
VGVFTNKITSVPSLPDYEPAKNHAPLARVIFSRLLDVMGADDLDNTPQSEQLHSKSVSTMYPELPSTMVEKLVSETVVSLAAIGGHDNPPARLIVGFEGIASVKDKLRTISEELEDFIEVSGQVDLPREGFSEEQIKAEKQEEYDREGDTEMDD